ncbi:MAG TPA: TetR family transcriptional regulator [Candidatus Binataceae bacterium]|jgi:DNA-binding transcriptional regulator YbjK
MLFRHQSKPHSSAEARRKEILEAALHIVADGGPDAITFRRVADRAQVPLGSLTYYFDSREDLLREAFRLYLSEAIAFISDVEDEKRPHTPSGIIELVLEIVRREFSDNPTIVRVEYELILYAARDPALAREFNAYERWMEARLTAALEELGAARPVDAARTIIDVVRGFEIERLTHTGAQLEDLKRRLSLVIEALISERSASDTAVGNRRSRRVRESNRRRTSVR